MDPSQLTPWMELVAATGAAGAVGMVMWRRWLRPGWRRLRALADLLERELSPNGGASLLDTVRRIDASQKQNEKHFRSLERRLGEVVKRVAKVEEATAQPKEVR